MPDTQNRDQIDRGRLKVQVNSEIAAGPIVNAEVEISYTGDPDSVIEKIRTDENGQTESVELAAPPIEYSMSPGENQPYSEYTVRVTAPDYEMVTVAGAQILADTQGIQNIRMKPLGEINQTGAIVIGPHTLWGDYPPKIAEAEIKPVNETGEIVLSRVVIPEYIIVHDGPVGDKTAEDHYVRYKDYIKNVAACEIYSTWPRATLEANILAIMSFTLNRVYTEWYRNKGHDFTITSSTAYDHKWMPGKTTYESINRIVDEIFSNYLSRPNVKQPILTQYCDGKRVTCPEWMTQWGSKYLGDQGYSPIEILRYYYGENMYINTAEQIAGIPSSWPGYDLTIGSSGNKVKQMQEQLNRISRDYPSIPKVAADGQYGEQTADAVRKFQNVFGLDQTGVVDYPTWYKISEIYVGVSRIAELNQ
ncbi:MULTISPECIES: peptidoglycan-binding protein [Anaerostipes]|uniref:peptidoglycan-binding protein n=1 Tax=Anaerostipes TaxID=207244 RepID=UPI000950CBDF|nr:MULTISPECIES: peptidoglycan-binding protein [Anaerostipes]MCI5622983.1 peptidoglycan-binding protein [Anaerostipes sp.]MDY2725323.1 peptidoglycan-binding protein [Anaerostipes faecalis]OLR58949.1 peptidoglycan-binding protein [Anaerostipes sp. 494a]